MCRLLYLFFRADKNLQNSNIFIRLNLKKGFFDTIAWKWTCKLHCDYPPVHIPNQHKMRDGRSFHYYLLLLFSLRIKKW